MPYTFRHVLYPLAPSLGTHVTARLKVKSSYPRQCGTSHQMNTLSIENILYYRISTTKLIMILTILVSSSDVYSLSYHIPTTIGFSHIYVCGIHKRDAHGDMTYWLSNDLENIKGKVEVQGQAKSNRVSFDLRKTTRFVCLCLCVYMCQENRMRWKSNQTCRNV